MGGVEEGRGREVWWYEGREGCLVWVVWCGGVERSCEAGALESEEHWREVVSEAGVSEDRAGTHVFIDGRWRQRGRLHAAGCWV